MEKLIVKTIFIGGGTPSVFPAEFILDILNSVRNKFIVDENAEVSIEVNPGTVDSDKLYHYLKMGINRLSIGAQALQDRLLKALGRIHSGKQIFECFKMAKNVGFENINLDLMFALPGQTFEDWRATLNMAVELNPTHLSVYSLIVEEGTPFFDLFERGALKGISDEDDREMYYLAKDILKKAGFQQYEISNFAKKGFECKHNIVYWKRKEYLGFGLGACSFFDEKRFHNNYDLLDYIGGMWFGENEEFSKNDAFSEFMFLGLRMKRGVYRKEFFEYFGVELDDIFGDKIEFFLRQRLLNDDGERVWLTERGADVSNVVFREFLI